MAQTVTKDLLMKILKRQFMVKFDILHFTSSNVLDSDENFGSSINRITITYLFENAREERTFTIITKCFPEDEYHAKFAKEMQLFENEIDVYENLLSVMNESAHQEKVTPCVYYTCMKPRPILLLEDMTSLQYKLYPRKTGLDLEHCLFVIENLAYFHAASFSAIEKDPKLVSNFQHTLFRKNDAVDLVKVSYEEVIKTCETHQGFRKYKRKLEKAKESILSKLRDVPYVDAKFKVINHGDLWTHNILFQYNTDRTLANLVFIDFSYVCYASPALDLHCFLASSIEPYLRKYDSIIIDHYFQQLIANSTKLGISTLPKREEFDEDFRLMRCYGFGTSIFIRALTTASPREGATIENFLKDNSSYRHHCFNNDTYLKEMLFYLPYYDSLGLFDV